jgi:hypothetical protein
MKLGEEGWTITKTGLFRLAVRKGIPADSYMQFAGASGSGFVNGIWKPGTVKAWFGTEGTWSRKFTYPESDQPLMEECEQDLSQLFPAEAFCTLDHIYNDLTSVEFDYDANEVKWDWNPNQVLSPAVDGVLNNHVLKYPFVQTTKKPADIACLIVNADPQELHTIWSSAAVSTEVESVTVQAAAHDVWFVSLFTDMQTTEGKAIERGKFYRITKTIELQPTTERNLLVVLSKAN